MSKILITLLSNKVDILLSTHFINSIKQENPKSEISILTYKDDLKYFTCHTGITEMYSIDRDFIQAIDQSELYSDSFALNNFFKSIEPCYEKQWDRVINYSNDNVGTYLSSMFNTNDRVGTSVSKLGNPLTSNIWSNYFNFVSPNIESSIIPPSIVRHYMAGMPYRKEGKKVKLNEEFSQIATTNFTRIRQSMPTNKNTYMVGINLEASFSAELICEKSVTEIVDALEASENFKPILILSDREKDQHFINELNEKFNNTIVSINTDRTAFPSVALNLDFLVTLNNESLVTADALETKIIEIRNKSETQRKTNMLNPENYVICTKEDSFADEVIIILNQECETELPISSMNSDSKVYLTTEDDYGFLMTQIRGDLDIESELRYHIERSYHYQLMGFAPDKKFFKHISENIEKNVLNQFITQSKDELTNTVKLLLATLRSLKGSKQSQNNLKNFVMYLDQIITKSTSNSITRAAIGLFEGRIESINSTDTEENMKMIEKHLFSLKNDLQSLANLFTDLMETNEAVKVDTQTL